VRGSRCSDSPRKISKITRAFLINAKARKIGFLGALKPLFHAACGGTAEEVGEEL
jgi:hypothetical protein